MVSITVSKNEDGVCKEVVLSGHAGYAEQGEDIVCAAISVLFINTINAIETFTEDGFVIEDDPKKDTQLLRMTSSISGESKLLLNAMLLGFEGIRDEYGKKYIKIVYKKEKREV